MHTACGRKGVFRNVLIDEAWLGLFYYNEDLRDLVSASRLVRTTVEWFC